MARVDLPPQTRYARRGGLRIAYQTFGEGPRAIVGVFGVPTHLDLMWTDAGWTRGLRRMASFARVVIFDRPGLGLSDPLDHVPTLEEQADDLQVVMDHAGVERATLVGGTLSASGVVLFAARSPERVDGLLLWAPIAQGWKAVPEQQLVGWEGKAGAVAADWVDVLERWGEGGSLSFTAPGLSDERLRRGWATFERASASPAMIGAISEAGSTADITGILPLVRAPTIVMLHADSPIPEGTVRQVAELIPDGTFRRLPPSTLAAGVADWVEPAVDEIERLVTGHSLARSDRDRILATVLFTDVVGSTELAARIGDEQWRALSGRHETMLRDHVEGAGGRVVDLVGDGSLSVFDGPARAIRCAQGICQAAPQLGLDVRAGLHTGECERVGDNLAGLAVHIGARVGAAAGAGEVWLSQTVRDLVAGSGIEFRGRGSHALKGVPGTWELFSVADRQPEPVAMAGERRHLKIGDRIVLTAARRAPGLVRAAARLDERSRRHRELKRLT